MSIPDRLCAVCGGPAVVAPSYATANYCLRDFQRIIEKRVRKDLRTSTPLDVSKKYLFLDDGSPSSLLTRRLLESIFDGRIALVSDLSATPGPNVIVPWCLEQEASARFERFLDPRLPSLQGIRPLRSVSVEDINHLMPGTALRREDFLHPLLFLMVQQEPGTLFSIVNALGK